MAGRSRPTGMKRQKEGKRRERKQQKAERLSRRRAEQKENPEEVAAEEDPDIAGIKPGPQPLPWHD